MAIPRAGITIVVASLAVIAAASASEVVALRPAGLLTIEPHVLRAPDGTTVRVDFGRLTVPENRRGGGTNLVTLAFLRFRGHGDGPPLVWLAGGPGGSGIADASGNLFPLFVALREQGDVIALDQRGAGLSTPRLDCPGRLALPIDRAVRREEVLGALGQLSKACVAHWIRQGVELAAYNTEESAADIDDLRRALGARKIRLLAASYGTHLALATIRHYGDSIDRAVLLGTQGPDHVWKLPGDVERHLDAVSREIRADARLADRVPDLRERMREVLERLERHPERVRLEGGDKPPVEVTVGRFDLEGLTRNMLNSREDLARLPALYAAMAGGDYRVLARTTLASRRGGGPSALVFTMGCAAGASEQRRARYAREAEGALLSDLIDFPFPQLCELWPVPDLGEEYRAPVRSPLPVLFVSGTLDGNTPPANAEEVLSGFPQGRHLLVSGETHDSLGLLPREAARVIVGFFRGNAPSVASLTAPAIPFGALPGGFAATLASEGRALERPLPPRAER
ncbi:MAG TPA: alpha/beta fold hydrolase [Thermoanaerobaculia bacterium]